MKTPSSSLVLIAFSEPCGSLYATHLNTLAVADKYGGLYIVRPVAFINFNDLQSRGCFWLNRYCVSGTPNQLIPISLGRVEDVQSGFSVDCIEGMG